MKLSTLQRLFLWRTYEANASSPPLHPEKVGARNGRLARSAYVVHRNFYILIIFTALLLAGCNLEAEPIPPTPTPLQPATGSFSTPAPLPTNAPIVSATATATSAAPVGCVVNTSLPRYVVRAGDTLSDIAFRANTTVQNLVTMNCLASPDQIFSGQTLYVPQLIDAPSARFMVVLPNDNGVNGLRFGCNDSAVPYNSGLELTGITQTDIQTSLTAMFTTTNIPAPYMTALPSGLTVNSVSVSGDLATVVLSGNILSSGTCADARIQGQLLLTIFSYSGIQRALITLNGQNLRKVFDTSGLIGDNDPYLASQWMP